jgi:hypothetical protein
MRNVLGTHESLEQMLERQHRRRSPVREVDPSGPKAVPLIAGDMRVRGPYIKSRPLPLTPTQIRRWQVRGMANPTPERVMAFHGVPGYEAHANPEEFARIT